MDLRWSLPLEPTFGHGFFPWLLTHLADGPLGCLPEIHPGWAALGLAPHCNVVDGLLSGEVALQRPLKFTWKHEIWQTQKNKSKQKVLVLHMVGFGCRLLGGLVLGLLGHLHGLHGLHGFHGLHGLHRLHIFHGLHGLHVFHGLHGLGACCFGHGCQHTVGWKWLRSQWLESNGTCNQAKQNSNDMQVWHLKH